MPKKIAVTLLIGLVWDIDGYPNYFFGVDKQLYRIDSRGRYLVNKRHQKRYTQGYVLKNRFYSLTQLRSMLRQHKLTTYPTGF